MIHKIAGEGGGYFFNYSLLHRHLDTTRVITTESSPLQIAKGWIWTGNLWFLASSQLAPFYEKTFKIILKVVGQVFAKFSYLQCPLIFLP